MKLTNMILPSPISTTISSDTHNASSSSIYDIEIESNTITAIKPGSHSHGQSSPQSTYITSPTTTCPPPSLLLPTLCHPHLHLDKPYLLTSHHNHPLGYSTCCPRPSLTVEPNTRSLSLATSEDSKELPDYSSISPNSGSFPEALQLTSKAKQLYTSPDLYLRGAQLLATSYNQGVTSARCFIEVDCILKHMALEVGMELKRAFEGKGKGKEKGKGVRIQLCAFAQDPVFSGERGEENRRVMEEALEKFAISDANENAKDKGNDNGVASEGGCPIEVLGTTPYIETSRSASLENIKWAIRTALKYNLHLDFHLDYNLDPLVTKEPERCMIWDVLRLLEEEGWPTKRSTQRRSSGNECKARCKVKTVVLGHCTALSLLSHTSLLALSKRIRETGLPVYFVGLPTSDVYMMGRQPSPPSSEITPLSRPLGSLNILALLSKYNLKGCIGVNNVGNPFTPFGTGDPLELAGWCVGLYHGGGDGDAERLYEMVSVAGRRALGLEPEPEPEEGKWGKDEGEGEETKEVEGKMDGGDDGEDGGLGRAEEGARGESKDGGTTTCDGGRGDKGNDKRIREFEVEVGNDISAFGLLLIQNETFIPGIQELGVKVPARRRMSVRDVVWDIPEVRLRTVVR